MSDSEDSDYNGGELRVDAIEMTNLLSVAYHFFTNASNRTSYPALMEAMIDALGYIYYCRRQWRRSTLLMSLESELAVAVRSHRAGEAVEQFTLVAEQPLADILDLFVRQKLMQL